MSTPTIHPLHHIGISQNQPEIQTHQPQHAQESTGRANHQPSGTIAGTEANFIPHHVFNFNHWVMNLTGRGGAWQTLNDRRTRAAQKGSGSTRHAVRGAADEAVDPISGRPRTAEVSLALNLLLDGRGEEQRRDLEEELKSRNLNALQRLHVYSEAAARLESEELPAEVVKEVKAALSRSVREIQSTNRHAIRRSMHDPQKLREALETIAGPLEKLMTVTPRELRNRFNPGSPHTEMSRVDVPLQALWLVACARSLAGDEHCLTFLAVLRKIFVFGDGLDPASRDASGRNFPRYQLAISDAKAFTLAQSALTLGSALRTAIANKVRISPALPAAAIGEHLLSAADGAWGKEMADRMVKKIVGMPQLEGTGLSKAFFEVRHALHLLPETAWEMNRLNARRDLLAELKDMGLKSLDAMPVHSIREEILEAGWLDELQEMRQTRDASAVSQARKPRRGKQSNAAR